MMTASIVARRLAVLGSGSAIPYTASELLGTGASEAPTAATKFIYGICGFAVKSA
jgi:hypothetical protein